MSQVSREYSDEEQETRSPMNDIVVTREETMKLLADLNVGKSHGRGALQIGS